MSLRRNQCDFHVTMDETWIGKQAKAAASRGNATSVRGRKKASAEVGAWEQMS
jgi:hypothetical protein